MKNDRSHYIGSIIEQDSYRLKDALEIYHAGNAFNFLPAWRNDFWTSYPTPKSSVYHCLRSWQNHFTSLDIPFFVTIAKYGKKMYALELWKERRV